MEATLTPDLWFDSDEEDSVAGGTDFDMKYFYEEDGAAASSDLHSSSLRSQVEMYFGAENAADMCRVIFESLASPRSDTELQNEVKSS